MCKRVSRKRRRGRGRGRGAVHTRRGESKDDDRDARPRWKRRWSPVGGGGGGGGENISETGVRLCERLEKLDGKVEKKIARRLFSGGIFIGGSAMLGQGWG